MRYPKVDVILTHPDSDEPEEKFVGVYLDLFTNEADELSRFTAPQYTWAEWITDGLSKREPDALKFLYWLARKRAGNPVECEFSEIDFYIHAIDWDITDPGDIFVEAAPEAIQLTGADPTEGAETVSS